MSTRLFLTLFLGLLVLWLGAAFCTTFWSNDMFPLQFPICRERWFGAFLHGFFASALVLTLIIGRRYLGKSAITLVVAATSFLLIIYFLGLWPSMLAAFMRAPWAKEGERGPAISAANEYAWYTWEWEVGPSGVGK
jgi:hypothetical protein